MRFELDAALNRLQAMIDGAIALLPNLLVAAVVFLAFLLAAKVARRLIVRALCHHASRGLGLVLGRLSQWIIGFVGLLVGFSILLPTFKPDDVIEILGIGGVAVGLAFRDILQNFLAGILILITHPFRIGDRIVFGEYEGTVEDIKTRATYITTYDGRRVVVPNAELFTNSVIVNTAFETRRSEYDAGIGYNDDMERAKQLILESMRGTEGVLAEPAPDVLTVDLAPSTVKLRARWWSQSHRGDVLVVQDAVIRRVKATLLKNGIDLPFSTRTVLFHDQTNGTSADPRRELESRPTDEDDVAKPRSPIDTSLFKIGRMIRGRDWTPDPPPSR